jgi:hypothetical protein
MKGLEERTSGNHVPLHISEQIGEEDEHLYRWDYTTSFVGCNSNRRNINKRIDRRRDLRRRRCCGLMSSLPIIAIVGAILVNAHNVAHCRY